MNGEIDTTPTTITFLSDGTYTASGISGSGNWGVRNNKVYIMSPTGGGAFEDVGLDYSFSDFPLLFQHRIVSGILGKPILQLC